MNCMIRGEIIRAATAKNDPEDEKTRLTRINIRDTRPQAPGTPKKGTRRKTWQNENRPGENKTTPPKKKRRTVYVLVVQDKVLVQA